MQISPRGGLPLGSYLFKPDISNSAGLIYYIRAGQGRAPGRAASQYSKSQNGKIQCIWCRRLVQRDATAICCANGKAPVNDQIMTVPSSDVVKTTVATASATLGMCAPCHSLLVQKAMMNITSTYTLCKYSDLHRFRTVEEDIKIMQT